MIIKSIPLLRTSVSVLLLVQGLSFLSSAQAASCPAGTSTVNFTWDGAASGNKAVWNFNDSSKTYTVNYTDTLGKAASVGITMKLRDPANINYDADLVDAGKHPYDPAGGCNPASTGETVNEWSGTGSINDPWDSDCFGDASGSSTGTRKAYGLGFLTWFIKSAQHTDNVYFDFTFSRPAMLMGDFTIGDIDGDGLTDTYNNYVAQEAPGNSYQDEVGFTASLNGADVPVTIFNAGTAVSVSGQTAKAIYHTDQNNNVAPTDPVGTVHAETAIPFDTFSIMYSDGADDAADEQAHPELYSWWSATHGATNGASDSQAVRVSGFTFCMAPPPVDYGDANSSYPTTSANNGAAHVMTQQLYMGSCVDGESDGQPSTGADGDNNATGSLTYGTCAVAGNDEDGITTPVSLSDGQAAPQITVATHNTTGADATLACWIDYNGDHTFDNATERATATVANGATSATLTLPDVPANASTTTGGSTSMRCRLASAAADVANPSGVANSGEVEDYVVTLSAAAAACSTIVNTANITGVSETDSNSANNTATVSVQANCSQPQTDLKLSKTVSPTEVRRGGTATYTLTLSNESDVDAAGVKVTDNLPAGVTLVSSNATQGTFAGGIWDVGTLKARATVTLIINVTVN